MPIYHWRFTTETFICKLRYNYVNFSAVRISGIVADVLSETSVIFVTVRRTFWLRNTFDGKNHPGLAMLLLKNGTIYFMYEFVYSTEILPLKVIQSLTCSVLGRYARFNSRVCNPIRLLGGAILYTRLSHHNYLPLPSYAPGCVLRRKRRPPDGMEVDQSIRFASRVIGPMGAPVDASRFDEDSDIEEEESVYAEDPLVAGLKMMSDTPKPAKDDMVAVQNQSLHRLDTMSWFTVDCKYMCIEYKQYWVNTLIRKWSSHRSHMVADLHYQNINSLRVQCTWQSRGRPAEGISSGVAKLYLSRPRQPDAAERWNWARGVREPDTGAGFEVPSAMKEVEDLVPYLLNGEARRQKSHWAMVDRRNSAQVGWV
ncbi:hypothetical protein B0H13DRAFT_1891447 [Mycena leptocephala]|nr:hypothetical protein B0H13DRAFT_1891447 [Mycena leptocephala]